MSAGNSFLPAAHLNETTVDRSHFSAQEARILVGFDDLHHAPARLKEWLRGRAFDVIHNKRLPNFKRHEVLLNQIILNDHSTDHVDQVTYLALKVGEAFPDKVTQKELEAAVVGGMAHDVAFMEAAEAWVSLNIAHDQLDVRTQVQNLQIGLELLRGDRFDEVEEFWATNPPPTHPILGKKELDPHTAHGEVTINEWMRDADMAGAFEDWDAHQRYVAAQTVLQHSNGSCYSPECVPLAAKLVRLTDKLHNTRGRSEHLLDARLLNDPRSVHQFVPASIEQMALEINQDSHAITAVYRVDTAFVENRMREFDSSFIYDRNRFLQDFDAAYKKALGLGAEVVATLFAADGQDYDPTARLNVRFEFVDGGEVVIRSYEPYISAQH